MAQRKPPRTGVLPGARPLKTGEKAAGAAAAALGAAQQGGVKAVQSAVKTRQGIRYALIPASAGFAGGFAAGRSIKKSAFGVPHEVAKGQLPGWGLYKGRRVKVLGYQGQNHAEVLDRGQRVGTHTKHITFLPDKPKPPKKKPPYEQGELF